MPENLESVPRDITERADWLVRLLAPITPDDFFARWYDRRPLRIPGRPDKFSDLPTASEFRRVLEQGAPWQLRRLPELYLHGSKVEPQSVHFDFVNMDGLEISRPLTDRIEAFLRAGATIACYGMHTLFPVLNDIVCAIGQALHAETEAHLFYSQKACQGLAPHYDCTDVIVMQLVGEKIWLVSEQRAVNPIAGLGEAEEYDVNMGNEIIELSKGDVLYIPRGTFHQAITTSRDSLHVSLVAKVPTNFDFLPTLVQQALQSDKMRAYFSRFDRSQPSESMETAIEQLMQVLKNIAIDAGTIAAFKEDVGLRHASIGPIQEPAKN